MADVFIKRFTVSHDGELYGPDTDNGPIIENLDDEVAANLVNGSGGHIVFHQEEVGIPSSIVPNLEENDQEKEDGQKEDGQREDEESPEALTKKLQEEMLGKGKSK